MRSRNSTIAWIMACTISSEEPSRDALNPHRHVWSAVASRTFVWSIDVYARTTM
jgi:hypothetical protein